MALPKRRHSSTRRDKRRTHDNLTKKVLEKCKVTGVYHEPHKAYMFKDKLYYKGRIVLSKIEE